MVNKGFWELYQPDEIGVHDVVRFGHFSFNLDTLIITWFSMILIIIFAIFAARRLEMRPRGAQNAFEVLLDFISGLVEGTLGPKGRTLIPLISTMFIFLFTCNLMGVIPALSAPTGDINTPAGMALMVFIFVNGMVIYKHGLGSYIKHYFKPYVFFFPINIIETFAKPLTLALRLFGNILAGDVLLIVLNIILPKWFPIPTIGWMMFSIFVATVQAFVFSILTVSYLADAYAEETH